MSDSQVHFGGPDRPVGLLRDLLAERIALVPTGGSIDWVTYYFRDRRLATALVEARGRGVARAAVAGSLLHAAGHGAHRSVLFTGEGNLPARRAYEALGYEAIGDYGLLLF